MRKRKRAFVLVVVVVLLSVLSVAVAVQLDTARGQSIDAARGRDEAAARAVAETCLDMLLAQTRGYISNTVKPPPDLDDLLDPDLISGNGDDFLPPPAAGLTNAVVFVPKTATSNANARHRLYRLGEGACLARFDDNSDDALPARPGDDATAPRGTPPVAEGPAAAGRDVPNRDRDRAVVLTATGVFPAPTGVADADIFERAHARVTLRRIVETSGGPALWAGDEVLTSLDNAVCGLGGIQAEQLSIGNAGALCACGEQNIGENNHASSACDYTSSSKPGSMCDDLSRACEPRVLGEVKAQPNPFFVGDNPKSTITKLIEESGGDPDPNASATNWMTTATVGNPANNGMLELYVRHRNAIDFNDHDGDANLRESGELRKHHESNRFGAGDFDNLTVAEIYAWNPGVNGLVPGLVAALGLDVTCRNALGVAVTCPATPGCNVAQFRGPVILPPCKFITTRDAAGNVTGVREECKTVDDDQGPNGVDPGTERDLVESPCWQLVAQLDGRPNQPLVRGDLVSSLTGSLLGVNYMGLREDTEMDGTREVFKPRGEPSGGLLGLGGLLGGLTGLIANVTSSMPRWDQVAGGTFDATRMLFVENGNIKQHPDWNTRNEFADEMVLLFENPADREVIFGTDWGTSQPALPIKALVLATGDVHFEGKVGVCCPHCTCPGEVPADRPGDPPQANSMPTRTGGTDATSATRACTGIDRNTVEMNPLRLNENQPITTRQAMRTGGHLLFEQEANIVGDLMGKTVHIKGGGCLIADVFGHGECTNANCPCPGGSGCDAGEQPNDLDRGASNSGCSGISGPTCEDPGVCIGNASGTPELIVVGATFSRGDVCVRDTLTTYGQIVAGDDIHVGPNVVVNHDGSTGGGVGAIVNTVAWIEAAR